MKPECTAVNENGHMFCEKCKQAWSLDDPDPKPCKLPSRHEKDWCRYIAGMIGEYLGEPLGSDKEKAIARIIERRMWNLSSSTHRDAQPAFAQPPAVANQKWELGEEACKFLINMLMADSEEITRIGFQVGFIKCDDEKIEHGLLVYDAEYPEEGATILAESEPAPAVAVTQQDQNDAARYRWLRDNSVPPHNFYLSVTDEFAEVRYTQQEVDSYIDTAIAAAKGGE